MLFLLYTWFATNCAPQLKAVQLYALGQRGPYPILQTPSPVVSDEHAVQAGPRRTQHSLVQLDDRPGQLERDVAAN